MRVVIQRVTQASVTVNGKICAKIEKGLLLLVGFEESDELSDIDWMTGKILRLRLFADEHGVMNRDVGEVQGDILAVSQFTLYASVKKGNRPSWSQAAGREISQPLFECFVAKLSTEFGRAVPTGIFGADMQVSLVNDGPVTLLIDSKAKA